MDEAGLAAATAGQGGVHRFGDRAQVLALGGGDGVLPDIADLAKDGGAATAGLEDRQAQAAQGVARQAACKMQRTPLPCVGFGHPGSGFVFQVMQTGL